MVGTRAFSRTASWFAALLSAAIAAFVLAPPASAAPGDLTFGSCVSNTGSAGTCSDFAGTDLNPFRNAISPDGKSLYVTSQLSDSINHFSIGPAGDLSFVGCFSDFGSGGECTDVPGNAFNLPDKIVLSPDGDSLYVTSFGDDSVTHFFVGPTGQLSFGGCVSQTGSGGFCADVPGSAFDNPSDAAMSPDGDSLYVTASSSDSVTHFFAAPGGQITFGGCVSDDGSAGACANAPGAAFDAPTSVAVSPDGASVYASTNGSESLTHFFAAPGGQITFGGCVSDTGSAGACADVPGSAFTDVNAIIVRPGGGSLYAASSTGDSVTHFFLAPAGQITFGGCVSQTGSGGFCADVPGSSFDDPAALAFSPDGASLYVAARGSNSLSNFAAAPAGQITFANCISDDGNANTCGDLPGSIFANPLSLAMSPRGDAVYATGNSTDSVIRFARELPADRTPPGLTLKVGKKPQAGKPLKVTVTCTEACAVDIAGTAKPKGSKRGKLKAASTNLGAGASATLKLKPKGKLKKSLRAAGKGKATIEATASDAAGNSSDATAKVKLK